MGHTTESYQDPLFLSHLLEGIRWAAGATPE
jgi:type 1 glutamine amidotransferase